MFFKPNIKNRVMEVINKKIDDGQKAHDEHVKLLEAKLEEDKAAHADQVVSSLVGKFL